MIDNTKTNNEELSIDVRTKTLIAVYIALSVFSLVAICSLKKKIKELKAQHEEILTKLNKE